MPEWTAEQKQVIETRNADILVTAAAGSGKTTVLVERILSLLTDPDKPVDIDRLLVVTFTDAAAAEMREKILLALEKKQKEKPADRHIARQRMLVHNASISTLHSFCLNIIRDHFQDIDLDPSFKTMETGEREVMMAKTLADLLEDCYRGETQEGEELSFLEEPKAFDAFALALETGKKDDRIEQSIRKLYEEAIGMDDPKGFLLHMRSLCGNGDDHGETAAKRWLLLTKEKIKKALMDASDAEKELGEVCSEQGLPAKFKTFFFTEAQELARGGEEESLDGLYRFFTAFSWNRIPHLSAKEKDVHDEALSAWCKERRNAVKKEISDLFDRFCYAPEAELLEDLRLSGESIGVLLDLTLEFMRRFEAEKREKNRIDFSDMEQLALRILAKKEDGALIPTKTAYAMQNDFIEVMVDEYQDISHIQETILRMVSSPKARPHNRFMVGDVKQSIYGFRQSRPELFMEKFHRYRTGEGEAERRIDLHRNFRSRAEVLHAANAVFFRLMKKEFGGIDYDEEQMLIPGACFPEKEPERVAFYLLDKDDENRKNSGEDTKAAESRFTAKKVSEIVAFSQVTDKETGKLRPARYGDVVVLLRKGSGWIDAMTEAFSEAKIPVYAERRNGFFDAEEIQVLLNYLRILDNPMQDIPLAGILSSSIGGFSADDLVQIRVAYPEENFAGAVLSYRMEKTDEMKDRLDAFLSLVEKHRKKMTLIPLHRLLFEILEDTGYGLILASLVNGRNRTANVAYLIKQAMQFETTSLSGVFEFLRYIDELKSREMDFGEMNANDELTGTVRLMTIHKSKGLEFPIVVIAGLGSELRKSDTDPVSIDANLGIALDAVDPKLRLKTPTIARQLIRDKKALDETAEEIRVLYVAMTRAKEKLVLIGSVSKPENVMNDALRMAQSELFYDTSIRKAKTQLDLLLPACMGSREYFEVIPCSLPEKETEKEKKVASPLAQIRALKEDTEFSKKLDDLIKQTYPYAEDTDRPFKLSVSEIKKRHMLEAFREEEGEAAEQFPQKIAVPLIPQFIRKEEKTADGAFRGTAYHRFLELYDYKAKRSAKEEVNVLKEKGFLTEDMASTLHLGQLTKFLSSDLAKRMGCADEKGLLKREQLFVLGEYPEEEAAGEDLTLVQGIIDAYFEEDGDLILVDYKTDRVRDLTELAAKYKIQLIYYKEALERLLHKTVREMYIYSFCLGCGMKL